MIKAKKIHSSLEAW